MLRTYCGCKHVFSLNGPPLRRVPWCTRCLGRGGPRIIHKLRIARAHTRPASLSHSSRQPHAPDRQARKGAAAAAPVARIRVASRAPGALSDAEPAAAAGVAPRRRTEFSQLDQSLLTLFSIVLGGGDYFALEDVDNIGAPMFYYPFLFVMVFVVFNVTIAIIMDGYVVMQERDADEPIRYYI